jgi:hypothetical protein
LPYLEIACGLTLLVGLWTRAAALLAIMLFASFATAIGINLARGKDLDCNCLGKLHQEKISAATLLRNFIFILLAVEALIFANNYLAIDGWLLNMNASKSNAPPVTGLIPMILAVVTLFIAYLLIQEVGAMIRSKQS